MDLRKCTVKAKNRVAPVEGSITDGMGTCPTCGTPDITLSKGGHIGAHNVAVEVDPTLPVVSTGSPKGDPRDATVRRAVEARRVAAGSLAMPTAPSAPEGRAESGKRAAMSPGPAMVRGRVMKPAASDVVTYAVGEQRPKQAAPQDPRTGFAARAGTMFGPTGRERMDREASTVPMVGGKYGFLTREQLDALSRTQQRKYWARVARMTRYAKDQQRGALARVPVRQGTGGIGVRNLAADGLADTERVMQQTPH